MGHFKAFLQEKKSEEHGLTVELHLHADHKPYITIKKHKKAGTHGTGNHKETSDWIEHHYPEYHKKT